MYLITSSCICYYFVRQGPFTPLPGVQSLHLNLHEAVSTCARVHVRDRIRVCENFWISSDRHRVSPCAHVHVSVFVHESEWLHVAILSMRLQLTNTYKGTAHCPQGDSPLHTWPLNIFSRIALRTFINTPCWHGHRHAHMLTQLYTLHIHHLWIYQSVNKTWC